MAWFRRKKADAAEDMAPLEEEQVDSVAEELTGPFDISQLDDLDDRLDLGVLKVPPRMKMNVRIELDAATRAPLAVAVGMDDSVMQLQVFAAPTSRGIWSELLEERAETGEAQNAGVVRQHGPFGSEIVLHLPIQTPAGTGTRHLRFVGIDGPRWMLQAMFIGPAAHDPSAAVALEKVLRDVVVDRGSEPLPPKRVIPVTIPGSAVADDANPNLAMPGRGPEIQEIR
ncbi:hypothetical protein BSZ39_01505 [Bowdeniella nasicola]|uniref:DUF3710 domain-containing protein n=1 Tax=Bowdeniella nasicola TaxID=208480 RepID=A0A1Q5Q4Y3_9ACTO|nr:DUF3710 domain-containing protein [Bowdeniella nasicola]OKL54885.1 hypothetical protein BSZ39_01505 [Bowdeniella nasicola]